jgi:holo-[acyl-carrier protein] synthase
VAIFGIGIDLIEVVRIKKAILNFGDRFCKRIFTEKERKFCEERKEGKYQSYAARFAAKEAFAKALGTGLRGKISWSEIEIIDDERHRPVIIAKGKAKEYLGERVVHLSISHLAHYVCAVCVIEDYPS